MSGTSLPDVLAGPFLRHTTPTDGYVWLATSKALPPGAIRVEFWDPAIVPGRTWDEPPIINKKTGQRLTLGTPDALRPMQSVQLTDRAYVHLLHTKFRPPLYSKKVYAYRAVKQVKGQQDQLLPPPGQLPRLPWRKPVASFVLGEPKEWCLWGVPSLAPQVITQAATDLQAKVSPPKRPPTAASSQAVPIRVVFLGTPFTLPGRTPFTLPGGTLPVAGKMIEQAVDALAKALTGSPSNAEEASRAHYAAAYLLAWSPDLLAWLSSEVPGLLASLPGFEDGVRDTAQLMANNPSYVLGRPVVDAAIKQAHPFAKEAAELVAAAFVDWPNAPDQPNAPTSTPVVRSKLSRMPNAAALAVHEPESPSPAAATPSPAAVVPGGSPADVLIDPKVVSDRIVTLVSVDPVLQAPNGAATDPPNQQTMQHEVTLVLSCTSGQAFTKEFPKAPAPAPAAASCGLPGRDTFPGRVVEVAASSGAPTASSGPPPCYATMSRSNDKVTLSTCPAGGGSKPQDVDLGRAELELYWFDGRSKEVALVIAGVHGTELSGVEVVRWLKVRLEGLQKRRGKPYFTTILVPALFPDSLDRARVTVDKKTGEKKVNDDAREFRWKGPKTGNDYEIPTNRQFPPPGEPLQWLLSRGGPTNVSGRRIQNLPSGDSPMDRSDCAGGVPLLAGTRALLQLIEQFTPTRIASVHGKHPPEKNPKTGVVKADRGVDAPGIFVDPRYELKAGVCGIDPVDGDTDEFDVSLCKFDLTIDAASPKIGLFVQLRESHHLGKLSPNLDKKWLAARTQYQAAVKTFRGSGRPKDLKDKNTQKDVREPAFQEFAKIAAAAKIKFMPKRISARDPIAQTEDEELALAIAQAVQSKNPTGRELVLGNHLNEHDAKGNPLPEVRHYTNAGGHGEGFSLGDWGPVDMKVTPPNPGKRPGAPVITVEVYDNPPSNAFYMGHHKEKLVDENNNYKLLTTLNSEQRRWATGNQVDPVRCRELQAYADALLSVFLGPP